MDAETTGPRLFAPQSTTTLQSDICSVGSQVACAIRTADCLTLRMRWHVLRLLSMLTQQER